MPLEIKNEERMDRALDALSSEFTQAEKWKINRAGLKPFERVFREKVADRKHTFPITKQFKEQFAKDYQPWKPLADTITVHRGKDDSAEIGFARKDDESYIARFVNDGWDVKNQFGGPWKHVEGAHYWEETEAETKDEVIKAEALALDKVLKKRGL